MKWRNVDPVVLDSHHEPVGALMAWYASDTAHAAAARVLPILYFGVAHVALALAAWQSR